MNQSLADEKRALRKRFREERARKELVGDWLHLLNADEIKKSSVIASYISYGFEPSTEKLNKRLLEIGKLLLLPRTNKDLTLDWIIIQSDSKFIKSELTRNLIEPVGEIFTEEIEVFIVPAFSVDKKGVRLGQGGGSYDRALQNSNSWKVALLHDGELSSQLLPVETHDEKVDAIALPNNLYRIDIG
jgi:5-formyltetrahydrofolate cyclo-ligase